MHLLARLSTWLDKQIHVYCSVCGKQMSRSSTLPFIVKTYHPKDGSGSSHYQDLVCGAFTDCADRAHELQEERLRKEYTQCWSETIWYPRFAAKQLTEYNRRKQIHDIVYGTSRYR